MKANAETKPIPWSDRLKGVIREIAAEVIHEESVFALCRQIVEQGLRPPRGVEIELEGDCVVVMSDGVEVARQFPDDPDDWFFEEGPWVQLVEEFSQALPAAA